MKHNEDFLDKFGHRDGMTVPDGYFDDFKSRMKSALPERPELTQPAVVKRSPWHRVRPYAYMAAMFMGIWCMLKLFTMLTATSPVPLDSNPVIAEALDCDDFVNEYVISDLSQWDCYDQLMEDGVVPDSLCDSVFVCDYID